MHLQALGSLKSRFLVVGVVLLLMILFAYVYTRPVIAPTVDTVATTTTEQNATSTEKPVEDFYTETNTTPMALDMKPWKWLSATYADGDVTTPVMSEAFLIRFNASGAFTAETDCNSISGSYEARNGGLSLGSIASTKMFCEGSQEAEFTTLLSSIVMYRFVAGGQLVMTTADGAEVVFR